MNGEEWKGVRRTVGVVMRVIDLLLGPIAKAQLKT